MAKKATTKKMEKKQKKDPQTKKEPPESSIEPSIEIQYEKTNITTEPPKEPISTEATDVTIKIEEMDESPEPIHLTGQNKPEEKPPEQPQPDITPNDPGEKKSGKIWVIAAIIVIIALIAVILNLDRLLPTQPPSDSTDNPVVATVNNQQITESELNKYYGLSVPESLQASITKDIFLERSLIPQTVLLQEAESIGISADDAEIDNQIEALAVNSGLTKEELFSRMAEQGIKEDDVILIYRNKVIIDKLLAETLLADKEIELPEMVRASHILVDSEEQAQSIHDQLEDGASFEELAQEHSTDATAENGGDLGYFPRGRMVPSFEEVAFSLEPGQTSDLVQSDFGYHIIKVTDKLEAGKFLFSEITNPVQKQSAINQQIVAIQTYTDLLVKKADVEIIGAEAPIEPSEGISNLDAFADCLTEKGAVLYGADWCSPCLNQKKVFGDSFDKINYVICTDSQDTLQSDECESAGIEVYPTWVINDQELRGLQSLEELGSATGCVL